MVDKLEAIRIVTRCTSREQFIGMFSRYCTPTSCFIPSADSRDLGTATAFTIRLANGEVLLRGEGVVVGSWSHDDHSFKRPGILLGIHRLDAACAELFEQLNEPRSLAVPLPPRTQLQMLLAAPPSANAELETPTVEMAPLALPEEPRLPPSPFVLPANPMAEMTDDAVAELVECHLGAEEVPTEIAQEPTERTPMARGAREVIATILGVAPLQKHVLAAPELVTTEGSFSLVTQQRPPTSPDPLLGVSPASPDAVEITYAPAPRPTLAPIQKPRPSSSPAERPRQRLRISELGIVPITQAVRGGQRRRWWIPATVATSVVIVALVVWIA